MERSVEQNGDSLVGRVNLDTSLIHRSKKFFLNHYVVVEVFLVNAGKRYLEIDRTYGLFHSRVDVVYNSLDVGIGVITHSFGGIYCLNRTVRVCTVERRVSGA